MSIICEEVLCGGVMYAIRQLSGRMLVYFSAEFILHLVGYSQNYYIHMQEGLGM